MTYNVLSGTLSLYTTTTMVKQGIILFSICLCVVCTVTEQLLVTSVDRI